jgi:hypothetical protein
MNCIFGIFDVLGFSSFCESCDFQNAEKVLKIMDDFETEIPKMVWDALDTENSAPPEKKEMINSRLRWLTFSDTVFVAMPYDLSAHPDKLKFDLLFFTILVAFINRRMFEIGLPVRGAVHIGDVIISKRCFAGKAIVDAHRLGQRIQVAGTVISEQANAFIFNPFSDRKGFYFMLKNLIIECDVPTGTKRLSKILCCNNCEKIKTLCWLFLQMGKIKPFVLPSDLNGFITNKFNAHGKKLSGYKEKMKVINTEKLFSDWKAANHRDYQEEVILRK